MILFNLICLTTSFENENILDPSCFVWRLKNDSLDSARTWLGPCSLCYLWNWFKMQFFFEILHAFLYRFLTVKFSTKFLLKYIEYAHSIYLSIYLPFYLPICLKYQSRLSFYLSIYLSLIFILFIPINLSSCLPIYLSLSIYLLSLLQHLSHKSTSLGLNGLLKFILASIHQSLPLLTFIPHYHPS